MADMKLPRSSKVRNLQNELAGLRMEAQDLRNSLNRNEDQFQNSFQSLMQMWGGMGQSSTAEVNSFSSLNYNVNYQVITIIWTALGFLYNSEGIVQAAIDMPVQDGFRGGLELMSREDMMDTDDIKTLDDDLKRTSFLKKIQIAFNWKRLYGGAALIVMNGENPQKPLTLQGAANRPMDIIPCHRWELSSSERYPKDGFYTYYGERIHQSRVKTLAGKEAPYPINVTLQYWGASEVEHIIRPLNIYQRTENVIFDLLKEAKVDIFRFEGFAAQLASAKGTGLVMQRVQLANQVKSTKNALLMDVKDEYEQKQLTWSGLAEMWKENRIGLACNLRIPMTKLFGISAAGFSSGEDDIENYCGMVESQIRDEARPVLYDLLQLKCVSLFGDAYDLDFEFYPMRTMTAVEEEQVKTSKHARWKDDASSGMLNPQEYMNMQQKEGLIPIESDVSKGAEPEPVMMEGQPEEEGDDQESKEGK